MERFHTALQKCYEKCSLFTVLFTTYILMLLCTVCFGLLHYKTSLDAMQQEVLSHHRSVISQSARVIDGHLSSLDQKFQMLTHNPYVERFAQQKGDFTPETYFLMYQMNRFLSSQLDNEFLRGFYIYFRSSDCIFTAQRKYAPEDFYQGELQYNGIPYFGWQDLIQEYSYDKVLPVQTTASLGQVVPVCRSIYSTGGEKACATAVVHIDWDYVRQLFADTLAENHSAVYFFNRDGEYVGCAGEIIPLDASFLKQLEEAPDNTVMGVQGKNLLVSNVYSLESKWRYVALIPEESIRSKVRGQLTNLVLALMLEILIGVALAFGLAKISHMPFQWFAQRLGGGEPAHGRNELRAIGAAIDKVVQEKEQIGRKLEMYAPMMRSHVLLLLITGVKVEGGDGKALAGKYGLHIGTEGGIVALFRLTDAAPEEEPLLKLALSNVLQELFETSYWVNLCEINHADIAVVLGFNRQINAPDDICRTGGQVISFFAEHFGVRVVAGVGCPYEQMIHICSSYRQAEQALECGALSPNGRVFLYENGDNPFPYFDILENFHSVMRNYIRLGDLEKAGQYVRKMVTALSTEELGADMARCCFYYVMAAALQVVTDKGLALMIEDSQKREIVQAMKQAQHLDDIGDALLQFCAAACHRPRDKKNHAEELLEKVTAIVRDEYGNENLSLTYIAEQLSINPSYLSTFFKKQTGEGLNEFISRIRVDCAKEYLRGTSLGIREIAAKVGYVNYNALIRSFKRQHGITPGQYRALGEPKA